jgi:hypothetical protein
MKIEAIGFALSIGALIFSLWVFYETVAKSEEVTDNQRKQADAFVEFLKDRCDTRVIIGTIPPEFEGVVDNAYLACFQRYGMAAPCVGQFVSIARPDGSYNFKVKCSPIEEKPDASN